MWTGIGTGRQTGVWIWIGLCAMISASGSFSHWTAGASWGRSPTRWNMTRNIRKDRQPGIWKDGEHRRGKRNIGSCENNMYQDMKTSFCCKKCSAGFYVADSCKQDGELPVCQPCPRGTYLAFENYIQKCRSCTLCDKEFQTTLRSCTATSNTVCGCHPHQYKQCHLANCLSFQCQNCSKCSNRLVIKNCSMKLDTQCGECLPGFHQHVGQCKACTEELCQNKSSPSCSCLPFNPPLMHTGLKPILILATVGSVFILFVMLQFLRQKFQRERGPEVLETPTVTVPEEDKKLKNEDKTLPFEIPTPDGKLDLIGEVLTQPLANNNIYGTSPQTTLLKHEMQAATSLKGKTLYEIINLVPVRRWKELMRLLELRDCDIERIEMDVAQSRDQQYEMLRQWSQQHTASMESVYQALQSMNLSGIVEELQTKLLNNTNSLH
ncbi:tumor necrosis factor receptor superfamily member 25 isoform X1 [Carcharodon carcharias]|uniref:tumor necrosis factor receptor superfamily member 25 isoform X1 n=1 Tax=Carcharodon carcharias TaxID=13397 RepID=UPI001B7EBC05|nr:tumor necrosis factor receptor superfamily member 25 isoform X1 [Carcharodon carcharias]